MEKQKRYTTGQKKKDKKTAELEYSDSSEPEKLVVKKQTPTGNEKKPPLSAKSRDKSKKEKRTEEKSKDKKKEKEVTTP